MPTTPLRAVLHAALSGTRQALARGTDAELLAAFAHAPAGARDEAAFTELVRRHGPLVRGTARRLVGDPDAAEDVFQATFLLLARKAAAVCWGATVGPWLYQAARRLAAKARARVARRRPPAPLGAEVAAPATDPSAGLAWAEIRAALDEALAALPGRLRDPLVLCYLEGLTRDEAAAALGCSPATVKGRVTRGRQRLRRLLAHRGLSLSAALAGSLVAESAVAADVATATARAAAAFRATGAASPAARVLLRGTPAGGKLAAGLVGLVLACAAGALGLARPGPDADPRRPPPASPRAEARTPAEPATDLLGDPLPAGAVARLGSVRLYGSGQPIGAAFSPDGSKIASRNLFSLEVWDADTGRALLRRTDYNVVANLFGWRADGTGVAVLQLADQSYFVSAFTDAEEKRPTPPAVHLRVIPNPYLHYLALSPDVTRLAVVQTPDAAQFTIDLLTVRPGQPVAALKREQTLGPFPGPCRDVRYTAGGQLATLHENEGWSVAVIDPDKNAVVRTASIPAPGFCPWQYMVSLSADARLAAVVPRTKDYPNSHDGTIRVCDLVAGKERFSLPFPNKGYGTGHAFSPDGKRLITSAGGPYFQVWDALTGKEACRSPAEAGGFYVMEAAGVAVSPDGKRFATARRDGRVDVWDTATGKAAIPLATHRDSIEAVAVSPDGRLAATSGRDNSVRVWELATGKPVCVIPAPRARPPSGHSLLTAPLAFTPDGRGVLFTAAGELALADPATGKTLALRDGMRGRRGNVGGFTADGKTLATFADDVVTFWDWPAGTVRVALTVPLASTKIPGVDGLDVAAVKSVALSPDGRFLFTNSTRSAKGKPAGGGFQNANDVWDGRTGKHLHRLTTPEPPYPPAAFAPDSRVLYLGGQGREDPGRGLEQADALTAWDPAAGTLRRRFANPGPGGANREETAFGRMVDPVAVSPDGRLLAAAEGIISSDRSVWLYETASGGLVKKLAGHLRQVTGLVFSPDGRRLVSVSQDQTGLVWDVTLPALGGAGDGGLDEAWDRLVRPDPQRGYAGMAVLAAAPAEAVPLLREKLRPAVIPADADLDRVVGQLDAAAFADREKAAAELERFGPNAVAGVKDRLGRATSAEVRKRLTGFLDRYAGPHPSPYELRCVRGVAVLEAAGTAEARGLLAELAKGPADDFLIREARAAGRRAENR
jgi:RNA polymerase sigma factor (sigma-70 family)